MAFPDALQDRRELKRSRPECFLAVCLGESLECDRFAVFDDATGRYLGPWRSSPDSAWIAAAKKTLY